MIPCHSGRFSSTPGTSGCHSGGQRFRLAGWLAKNMQTSLTIRRFSKRFVELCFCEPGNSGNDRPFDVSLSSPLVGPLFDSPRWGCVTSQYVLLFVFLCLRVLWLFGSRVCFAFGTSSVFVGSPARPALPAMKYLLHAGLCLLLSLLLVTGATATVCSDVPCTCDEDFCYPVGCRTIVGNAVSPPSSESSEFASAMFISSERNQCVWSCQFGRRSWCLCCFFLFWPSKSANLP